MVGASCFPFLVSRPPRSRDASPLSRALTPLLHPLSPFPPTQDHRLPVLPGPLLLSCRAVLAAGVAELPGRLLELQVQVVQHSGQNLRERGHPPRTGELTTTPKAPMRHQFKRPPLTHAFLPFKTFDHDGLVTTGSDHPLSHRRDHLQAPGPPPPGDQRHRAVVEQEVKVPEGVLCAAHVLAYHRVPFGLPLRGQDFVQQDLRPVLAVPEPVLEVRSMRREH